MIVFAPQDEGNLKVEDVFDLGDLSLSDLKYILGVEAKAAPAARRCLMEKFGLELPIAKSLPVSGEEVVFTDGCDFVGATAL